MIKNSHSLINPSKVRSKTMNNPKVLFLSSHSNWDSSKRLKSLQRFQSQKKAWRILLKHWEIRKMIRRTTSLDLPVNFVKKSLKMDALWEATFQRFIKDSPSINYAWRLKFHIRLNRKGIDTWEVLLKKDNLFKQSTS